jgi:hypothetical protein
VFAGLSWLFQVPMNSGDKAAHSWVAAAGDLNTQPALLPVKPDCVTRSCAVLELQSTGHPNPTASALTMFLNLFLQ